MAMAHLVAMLEPSKAVQHRLANLPPQAPPPIPNRSPSILGNDASIRTVGNLMLVHPGTWYSDAPITFKYQWYRNTTMVVGATKYAYISTASDVGSVALWCMITAKNSAGSTSVQVIQDYDLNVYQLFNGVANTLYTVLHTTMPSPNYF